MNLKPLYEKIVIKLLTKQEVKTESGLAYVRDMSISNNVTMMGEVVAIGDGRLLADGTVVPLKIKVGDKVIYSKHSGENYNDGKEDYVILSEQSILAIVQED